MYACSSSNIILFLYFDPGFRPAHDDSAYGGRSHLGVGEVVCERENGSRMGKTVPWPARQLQQGDQKGLVEATATLHHFEPPDDNVAVSLDRQKLHSQLPMILAVPYLPRPETVATLLWRYGRERLKRVC